MGNVSLGSELGENFTDTPSPQTKRLFKVGLTLRQEISISPKILHASSGKVPSIKCWEFSSGSMISD